MLGTVITVSLSNVTRMGNITKMAFHFGRFIAAWRMGAAMIAIAGMALAEPQHGIAMYGDPALPPDFVSLPYANPDAPKAGASSHQKSAA